jgi:signal transduction histidine kinase
MKSERFKTELITNVSHDIKTPVTSIINYVGLIKSEQIENEKAVEYIDVIDRQSQRLKKLTEDILEASKASAGVINTNISKTNVSELLKQCAGEFSERLEIAGLELVLDVSDGIYAMCDGRLMWRVFDNLLSNAHKYSLPGTRVYITADQPRGNFIPISVKNISKNRLNIPGEELMERFVRGDLSRQSEGSGLGLSISKSLMNLQKGDLFITIDGDFFKAELLLPIE